MNGSTKWVVFGIGVLFLFWVMGSYNSIITNRNNVGNKWGQLQSTYQRRLDLANQLVPVVTAGSQQELAVFKTLRDQAASLRGSLRTGTDGQPVVPQGAEAEALRSQIEGFDKALVNVIAYVASNPQIRSVELFSNLMTQLEGSENRVNVARRDYNDAVTAYRQSVQLFPGSIVAGLFGFNASDYALFQGSENAQQVPVVAFPTPNTR